MKGNIARSSFVLIFFSISIALSQFIVQIFISRVYGSFSLGEYAYIQAVLVPISYFIWMSLRPRYVSGLIEESGLCQLFRQRLVIDFFWYFLIYLIMLKSHDFTNIIVLLAMSLKYIDGLYDLVVAYFQRVGGFYSILRFTFYRFAFFILFLLLIYYGFDSLSFIMFLFVNVLFVVIKFEVYGLGSSNIFESIQGYICSLKEGIIFGLINFLMSVNVVVPRFVIEYFLGLEMLGVYFANFHFVVIGSILIGSFGSALLPYLKKAIELDDRSLYFNIILKSYFCIFVVSVLAVILSIYVGVDIVKIIYGNEIAIESKMLIIYSASVALPVYLASISGVLVFALGLKKIMLYGYAFAIMLNIFLCSLLISEIGVSGAYLSICVCSIFISLFFYISGLINFEGVRHA